MGEWILWRQSHIGMGKYYCHIVIVVNVTARMMTSIQCSIFEAAV